MEVTPSPEPVNGSAAPAPRERNTKDSPFCWQHKIVLRRIRERFRDSNKTAHAIAIYAGLTEIASDQQKQRFQVSVAAIAEKAGTSYKTTLGFLRELDLLGVVRIERQTFPGSKLDAPAIYTLPALCSHDTPLGSADIPLCNGGVQPCTTYVRRISEEGIEESEKKLSSPSARKDKDGSQVKAGESTLTLKEFARLILPVFNRPVDDRLTRAEHKFEKGFQISAVDANCLVQFFKLPANSSKREVRSRSQKFATLLDALNEQIAFARRACPRPKSKPVTAVPMPAPPPEHEVAPIREVATEVFANIRAALTGHGPIRGQ